MSACVRLLIACAAGEGHGFNQATRHFSQKSCRLSHKHTRSCISNAVVNPRDSGSGERGLEVMRFLFLVESSSTWMCYLLAYRQYF